MPIARHITLCLEAFDIGQCKWLRTGGIGISIDTYPLVGKTRKSYLINWVLFSIEPSNYMCIKKKIVLFCFFFLEKGKNREGTLLKLFSKQKLKFLVNQKISNKANNNLVRIIIQQCCTASCKVSWNDLNCPQVQNLWQILVHI